MTTITPVSNSPVSPSAEAKSKAFISQLLAGYTVSGMWREAAAFLENYTSVQDNSMKMMGLSQSVQETQLSCADFWIAQLQAYQNNITQAIGIYNQSSKDQAAQTALQNALTANQGGASIANTQYNSSNQFWSGLNNGLNQTSSDATQTETLDMQMFQQGILALQQQLANAM